MHEFNVHFVEVIPGTGDIDYSAYVTELAKLETDPPLMMEHLKTAEEYAQGAKYIMADAQASAEKQISDIENLIARGANALIVRDLPDDCKAIVEQQIQVERRQTPVEA